MGVSLTISPCIDHYWPACHRKPYLGEGQRGGAEGLVEPLEYLFLASSRRGPARPVLLRLIYYHKCYLTPSSALHAHVYLATLALRK